jgi:hypothetical protein
LETSADDSGPCDEALCLTFSTGRPKGEDLSIGILVVLNKTVFVDFADQIETFFCQAFEGPEDHFHGTQDNSFRDGVS